MGWEVSCGSVTKRRSSCPSPGLTTSPQSQQVQSPIIKQKRRVERTLTYLVTFVLPALCGICSFFPLWLFTPRSGTPRLNPLLGRFCDMISILRLNSDGLTTGLLELESRSLLPFKCEGRVVCGRCARV